MTRRPTRSRRRKPAGPLTGILGQRRGRGLTGLGLVLVLGGWFLGQDLATWLPAPLAEVAREAEGWIDAKMRDLSRGQGSGVGPSSGSAGSETAPLDPATAAEALALLNRVPVAQERPRGYDREAWPHWIDADGDCMDARHEVLMAESLERVGLTRDGCRVVSGLWQDAYTGETYTDPSDLDVDHMVPLAEAHRSGGIDWDTARRAAFANDLDDARTLIAVSAGANRSKSDQGPEEWLPPLEAGLCRYTANWVAVKVRWSLSMDERERVTVGNILQACARA